MSEFNFEKATKVVLKGLFILAVVTLVEVLVSLFAKPFIGKGAALIIIILSLYKAYFIVMSFMHMGHESKFLKLSIILPFILLVWGIYAFLQEGNSWGARRGFHDDVKKEYIIKAKPEPTHEVHGQDDHAH